jgi:putative oxidoreductase
MSEDSITGNSRRAMMKSVGARRRRWSPSWPRVVQICRFILGTVFVLAGVAKLLDPATFAEQINYYHLSPWPLSASLAVFLPFLELISGVLLIVDKLVPGALLLLTAALLVFTFALISASVRGLDIDCGCFGKAIPAVSIGWALLRNLALLVVSGIIWRAEFQTVRR